MDTEGLSRKCDRQHEHTPIQGSFARASAVYVDELARQLAFCLDKSLQLRMRCSSYQDSRTVGLESPLVNDLLLSGEWETVSSWIWKRPAHINMFETNVACMLLKNLAISSPHGKSAIVMDSNVGLSSLVKGRSPSEGLRKCTRRAGATCVVGDLYPSYHFGPTRWNVADCPTRCHPLPCPLASFAESRQAFQNLEMPWRCLEVCPLSL